MYKLWYIVTIHLLTPIGLLFRHLKCGKFKPCVKRRHVCRHALKILQCHVAMHWSSESGTLSKHSLKRNELVSQVYLPVILCFQDYRFELQWTRFTGGNSTCTVHHSAAERKVRANEDNTTSATVAELSERCKQLKALHKSSMSRKEGQSN